MKHLRKLLATILVVVVQVFSPLALAAPVDVSIATLNISGNVPAIFSVTARGYPGDLDLSPNVSVHDRLLGVFHFKYNIDINTINLASTQQDGVPSRTTADGDGYDFGGTFRLKFSACTAIHADYEVDFDPSDAVAAKDIGSGTGVDIAAAGTITEGVEEECDLTASWTGDTSDIPLAGKYSYDLTITMTSI